MFYGSAPLFLVTDLNTSLDYYCDVLGFERPAIWGDPAFFAMPKRENIIIMLQERGEAEVRHNLGKWDAYFWVKHLDELFQNFNHKGALIAYEPEIKRSYGCYEFAIRDPDGYTLAFGQEYEGDPFFEINPIGQPASTEFLYMSPVLASSDVSRDIQWYEDKLGFRNVYDSSFHKQGPIDYAVVGRQKLYLHLQFQYPQDMTSTDIRFQVQNIEPLFQEFISKGLLTSESMRRKTAWGTSEFGLFDPSGNRITFFEDL